MTFDAGLIEVHCTVCNETDAFHRGQEPSRFVCSDCKEKEQAGYEEELEREFERGKE